MGRNSNRLTSALATVLIQGVLGYVFVMTLATTISRQSDDKLTTVDLTSPPPPKVPPVLPPLPKVLPVHSAPVPSAAQPVVLQDWAEASPEQRNLDFAKAHKWVQDNLPEE